MDERPKRRVLLAALIVLAAALGAAAWYKLYREVPQPAWIGADPRDDFLYGSVGTERAAGMPYWIWLVLPRICPDHMPGPGGYAALGPPWPWEQGREMPAGFAKKTVGYVRVAGNCALCHASSRPAPDGVPEVVVGGPARDVQGLQAFYTACAQDPHFNADEILSEIDMVTKLSVLDHLFYRFVLIPRTRQAILDGRLMLDETLRRHSQEPRSAFTQQRMKALAAWLEEQRQTAVRPAGVRTGGRN